MKKYWKTIVVLTVLVVGIGSYLVQTSLVANSLPELQIEHVSGDESLAESVVLSGKYADGKSAPEWLTLDYKGTEYMSERSFIEQMVGKRGPVQERLIDEHKGFMRGVSYLHDNFYEDDEVLAVAETSWDFSFQTANIELSYLKKESGEEVHETLHLGSMDYAHILEVQYHENKIMVFAEGYFNNGNGLIEMVYDLEEDRMTQNELLENKSQNSNHMSFSKVNDSVTYQPMDHLIFRSTEEQLSNEGRVEVAGTKFYQYDVNEMELSELELPINENGFVSGFDGNTVYFEEQTPEEIKITPFNIEGGDFKEDFVFEKANEDDQFMFNYKIKDGNLYVLNHLELRVIDLENKETLYEGEITIDNEEQLENLELNRMEFR
ncbi:hypothetical protein [Aquisalibacillus elongatus]|uniref:Uncharacterized protein n=1 Tax=Aquisalibacillus elongatus TaxID=485577 RepID=A0A3N5BC06_9BACI|nr:hypothetical protein [Aquisalibacillus elongatus]RPF55286.1 hypothetical protein EDC24_0157 [Aquisalibacillus elongatus]